MNWQPHVTVATVVENNGTFLLVEELANGELVFNQPAGHLDPNESLEQAAIRETFEETGWHVELLGVVGAALYRAPGNGVTYHRTTFYAKAIRHVESAILDKGIQRAVWLCYEDILQRSDRMRSPLVIKAIEQYRDGHQYPLSMIYG